MRKTVKINGYDFDALIDTGSTITLIRESVYQILGRPTLNATKIKLTSFSKSEIKLFGTFKSTINIEDNKFMTDIYVIDNSQTTIDVIIGTDVLKQTEFKISANGIELIPKKKDHFINLINVPKAHNQSELKDNALEVLQLKLKNAEDKCKNLEMHVSNTSTLSLEKTALLDKLHKLEESNLEKVEKLVKLEENKRKTKKSKSSGRNANKTSDSDENEAIAKEKKICLDRLISNSIILDTKLKEPNKSKAQFFKKHESVCLQHFWIFFRCGQLIFRMADCEVEGTIASPPFPLERAMSPTGERSDEGTSELNRIRWDRKRGRRASAKQ
ncbi:uncharacterized protein TNCV_360331 [Trichonephila clavipes]|uniref:Peptidase A2 domain-containing protein n=1 Tax=Trichonephila clavipes TaxID=2585209 RepID=A0A8X6SBM5_TRICX|nr:uncharacterized protein TNCV_360331 [Trichonephila clavipes]